MVGLDVLNVSFVVPKNADRANIRRPLGQNHVTLVEKQTRNQVESVLRTGGHHDIFDRRLDSLECHELTNLIAQLQITLTARILNSQVSAVGHQGFERASD